MAQAQRDAHWELDEGSGLQGGSWLGVTAGYQHGMAVGPWADSPVSADRSPGTVCSVFWVPTLSRLPSHSTEHVVCWSAAPRYEEHQGGHGEEPWFLVYWGLVACGVFDALVASPV